MKATPKTGLVRASSPTNPSQPTTGHGLNSSDLATLRNVLRAMSEQSRLDIVRALSTEQLCVCHLTEILGLTQPQVSNHLRVLREAGIVERERYRYWTYYRLSRGPLKLLLDFVAALDSDSPKPRRPCES